VTTFPKPLDSSEASTMRGHIAARIGSKLDAKTDKLGWLQTPGINLKCIGWEPGTQPFPFLGESHKTWANRARRSCGRPKGHMLFRIREIDAFMRHILQDNLSRPLGF
jgi:hypothetical protein